MASTGKVQAPHGGAKCCDTGLEIGVCLSCEGLIAEPLDSAYRFSDSAGFLRARFGELRRSQRLRSGSYHSLSLQPWRLCVK